MAKIIISPNKYVQGSGELANIGKYTAALGKKAFVLISKSGLSRSEKTLSDSFTAAGCEVCFEIFNGECSKNEINRIVKKFEESKGDIVIGVGGGKIHDTAKAVAYYAKAPVAIVPTIASTDAPCSALSVIYTDDGVFEDYLFLPSNPNLVVVDTDIVVKAPARLLVAGMGDALATYFEARAAASSNTNNCAGGKITLAAAALSRLCYETLIAEGLKAKLAVERGVCTKAVEDIVEANTLLSGLGFESGGLGAAHAIHNGFTVIEECHHLYHGEKVAFGTLSQLVLENAPIEEIEELISFCQSVGLPTTLADLGITKIDENAIMEVAKLASAPGESVHNMPFDVTAIDVYAAIMGADALGNFYK